MQFSVDQKHFEDCFNQGSNNVIRKKDTLFIELYSSFVRLIISSRVNLWGGETGMHCFGQSLNCAVKYARF